MTNYEYGVKVERLVKHLLEKKGYMVIRSAGSKGLVDLVAVNEFKVRLIQVKTNKRACDLSAAMRTAEAAFEKVPKSKACTYEVWGYCNGTFTIKKFSFMQTLEEERSFNLKEGII